MILVAIATWIIPAGKYQVDTDGAPIPGTYQPVPANPQKLLVSALMGPINGMYGIRIPPATSCRSATARY